jgi:hypothetical protein
MLLLAVDYAALVLRSAYAPATFNLPPCHVPIPQPCKWSMLVFAAAPCSMCPGLTHAATVRTSCNATHTGLHAKRMLLLVHLACVNY